MNNSVILQGADEHEMHLLLHSFTGERKKRIKTNIKHEKTQKLSQKNKDAKKNQDAYFRRTETHNFKNEDARKTKRKTQIFEERCKLSSASTVYAVIMIPIGKFNWVLLYFSCDVHTLKAGIYL